MFSKRVDFVYISHSCMYALITEAYNDFYSNHKENLFCENISSLVWKAILFIHLLSVFGGGDVCNSEKSVNSGFGKGYVYLSKSKNELKREFMNVKINYKMNKIKIMVIHAMGLDRNYYFTTYSVINLISKSVRHLLRHVF